MNIFMCLVATIWYTRRFQYDDHNFNHGTLFMSFEHDSIFSKWSINWKKLMYHFYIFNKKYIKRYNWNINFKMFF